MTLIPVRISSDYFSTTTKCQCHVNSMRTFVIKSRSLTTFNDLPSPFSTILQIDQLFNISFFTMLIWDFLNLFLIPRNKKNTTRCDLFWITKKSLSPSVFSAFSTLRMVGSKNGYVKKSSGVSFRWAGKWKLTKWSAVPSGE